MSNEQVYLLILFLALVFFFFLALHYKKKAERMKNEAWSLATQLYQEIKEGNQLKDDILRLIEDRNNLQNRLNNVKHVFFNETDKNKAVK